MSAVGAGQSKPLSAKQAAVFLGMSPATLAQWRHRKTGPPYKRLGRSIKYYAHELEVWLDANTVHPHAD